MEIQRDIINRTAGTLRAVSGDGTKAKTSNYFVEGYASTWHEYDLFPCDDFILRERIDRHAFDHADMSDIVFLKDHTGTVLARTKNGLLTVRVDDHGLYSVTNLGETEEARRMYENISKQNYTKMSFQFTVKRDHYEQPADNVIVRVIDEIDHVYDVSAVGFPANPTTNISVKNNAAARGNNAMQAERLKALISCYLTIG